MAYAELPSKDLIRQLLEYEPQTGRLFWKPRTVEFFAHTYDPEKAMRSWNGRQAGKQAFAVSNSGYRTGRILNWSVCAHRLVWALHHTDPKQMTIDHINGDRDDNRIENLRAVPMVVNARNASLRKGSKTGVTGVSYCGPRNPGWSERAKPWHAKIKVDGNNIFLGTFASKEEAANARANADKLYGFHDGHGKPSRGYYRP